MPEPLHVREGIPETGLPFVERRFILSQRDEIRTSFCRPEAISPRLWRCSYRISWADNDFASHAYGTDGVQALLLAMERVHRKLLAEAAYRDETSPSETETGAVTLMGQRDFGFPKPGTVDTAALHVALFADAQIDRGDLDQIILEECSYQYRKVARIAAAALDAIGVQSWSARIFGEFGSDAPDLPLDLVLSRLEALVAAGRLELQGDLSKPRSSEVRQIPT